jgi:hypothetical protein
MCYFLLKGKNTYFNSIYEYAVGTEGQIKSSLVKTNYMNNNMHGMDTKKNTESHRNVNGQIKRLDIYQFTNSADIRI